MNQGEQLLRVRVLEMLAPYYSDPVLLINAAKRAEEYIKGEESKAAEETK